MKIQTKMNILLNTTCRVIGGMEQGRFIFLGVEEHHGEKHHKCRKFKDELWKLHNCAWLKMHREAAALNDGETLLFLIFVVGFVYKAFFVVLKGRRIHYFHNAPAHRVERA